MLMSFLTIKNGGGGIDKSVVKKKEKKEGKDVSVEMRSRKERGTADGCHPFVKKKGSALRALGGRRA